MSQSGEKGKFPDAAGYVGFANLPNQVHRKSVKKGFEFTLMVVEKIERTVQIEASTVEIEERGVKLRLTVVDTPGYGDAINSQDCFKTIIQYIDNQFERYLHDESGLNRRHIVDNRVHCCFYFISPFGHGLKPLDVEFMKAIHSKVNIVPVIAKADTLTLRERDRLKRRRTAAPLPDLSRTIMKGGSSLCRTIWPSCNVSGRLAEKAGSAVCRTLIRGRSEVIKP
ncbi:Septin-2 [Anabarilius grahami]|uniref:Septin-2 n=1 Tax=Anabarilius grahami TaxID=495550 RepID=A0A3N0XLH8_ANAGA|nr:Septin-2 [Anabarilius grahami]